MLKRKFVNCLIHKKCFSSIKTCIETPIIKQNKTTRDILKDYGYGYGNKMLYNSKIEDVKVKLGFHNHFAHHAKKQMYKKKLEEILVSVQPLPISLKYYNAEKMPSEECNVEDELAKKLPNEHSATDYLVSEISKEVDNIPSKDNKFINFPLAITQPFNTDEQENIKQDLFQNNTSRIDEIINRKYEILKKEKNWMTSYDNFEYDLEDEQNESELADWSINYGTPNPHSEISNVPCGGCGALLHCKVRNSCNIFLIVFLIHYLEL